MSGYLKHYGVKGMKWGVRRYQNYDGTLTEYGKARLSRDPERRTSGERDLSDHQQYRVKNYGDKVASYVSKYNKEHPVEKLSEIKKMPSLPDDDKVNEIFDSVNRNNSKRNDVEYIAHTCNDGNSAIAYEMCKRGYDVEARPSAMGINPGRLSDYFERPVLFNQDQSLVREQRRLYNKWWWSDDFESPKFNKGMNELTEIEQKLTAKFEKAILSGGEGSRGIAYIAERNPYDAGGKLGVNFTAVNYEVKNGRIYEIDTSNMRRKNTISINYDQYSDPAEFSFFRTDNLKLKDNVGKAVTSRR